MIGDAYADLAGYVADADLGLGCGVPTRHAGIGEGDVVLDLGSGAGIDALVARRSVGEAGRVIGVDMTAAMIERARNNAANLGYGNVEFRLGEIEHLPVPDNAVDVVISNCVLNLVPDKARAFAETLRVLKPGGHFCVSDIIATGALPQGIRAAAALYVGCVAGAMAETDYVAAIEGAGFKHIRIVERKPVPLPDEVASGAPLGRRAFCLPGEPRGAAERDRAGHQARCVLRRRLLPAVANRKGLFGTAGTASAVLRMRCCSGRSTACAVG